MGKKKTTRTAVNQQHPKEAVRTGAHATGRAEGLRSLTPSDEGGLIGDLMFAAQGAALLLSAAQEHVEGSDWVTVTAGVQVVLASVANQVDARYFERLGICLESDAVDPRHRLYLLEQQAAELREKIAEKQRGR